MDGGKLSDFAERRYETVRRRTLGFQKVRTHNVNDHRVCRAKVQAWLRGWYPAEVEGSDCKSIEDIVQGETCWLKLGDFSFKAVKFALFDKENRLSQALPKGYSHSYIQSIAFEGGILDGQVVHFSPELNTLIGIRGSGKSSILEGIRYTLNIPFGEKATDLRYKESLIEHTFGSGGKVEVRAIDRYGQECIVRRILHEHPEVYVAER